MDDDRVFCKDCSERRGAKCVGDGGFWQGHIIPRELRARPIRCEGYRLRIDDDHVHDTPAADGQSHLEVER